MLCLPAGGGGTALTVGAGADGGNTTGAKAWALGRRAAALSRFLLDTLAK